MDRNSFNFVGSAKSSFDFYSLWQKFRKHHPLVTDSAKLQNHVHQK